MLTVQSINALLMSSAQPETMVSLLPNRVARGAPGQDGHSRRRWAQNAPDDPIYYLAIRSFERLAPIVLNVVMILLADVRVKNLPGSVAQFWSKLEVGSCLNPCQL